LAAMSPFSGGLERARALLTERFRHVAFRVHQLKVVGPLLAGRNVLAVLPTGAGKSLCYQLPALMAGGLTPCGDGALRRRSSTACSHGTSVARSSMRRSREL